MLLEWKSSRQKTRFWGLSYSIKTSLLSRGKNEGAERIYLNSYDDEKAHWNQSAIVTLGLK